MPESKWNETKIGKGKWAFRYTRWVKERLKPGTKRVKAKQYAVKTGTDTYKLIMKGKRYPLTRRY